MTEAQATELIFYLRAIAEGVGLLCGLGAVRLMLRGKDLRKLFQWLLPCVALCGAADAQVIVSATQHFDASEVNWSSNQAPYFSITAPGTVTDNSIAVLFARGNGGASPTVPAGWIVIGVAPGSSVDVKGIIAVRGISAADSETHIGTINNVMRAFVGYMSGVEVDYNTYGVTSQHGVPYQSVACDPLSWATSGEAVILRGFMSSSSGIQTNQPSTGGWFKEANYGEMLVWSGLTDGAGGSFDDSIYATYGSASGDMVVLQVALPVAGSSGGGGGTPPPSGWICGGYDSPCGCSSSGILAVRVVDTVQSASSAGGVGESGQTYSLSQLVGWTGSSFRNASCCEECTDPTNPNVGTFCSQRPIDPMFQGQTLYVIEAAPAEVVCQECGIVSVCCEIGDGDQDGIYGAADPDSDNDGVDDACDPTPLSSNCTTYGPVPDCGPNGDYDHDGMINSCDIDYTGGDADGDGIPDAQDATPYGSCSATPGECGAAGDADGDDIRNDMESDADGDGTPNEIDADPYGPNCGTAGLCGVNGDADGDGIINSADPDGDKDGDGILDGDDASPEGNSCASGTVGGCLPGDDFDGDGIRNDKDSETDIDGDGIPNVDDNTPYGCGPGTSCVCGACDDDGDADGDGMRNDQDGDADNDGISNGIDPCERGCSCCDQPNDDPYCVDCENSLTTLATVNIVALGVGDDGPVCEINSSNDYNVYSFADLWNEFPAIGNCDWDNDGCINKKDSAPCDPEVGCECDLGLADRFLAVRNAFFSWVVDVPIAEDWDGTLDDFLQPGWDTQQSLPLSYVSMNIAGTPYNNFQTLSWSVSLWPQALPGYVDIGPMENFLTGLRDVVYSMLILFMSWSAVRSIWKAVNA